ncbi:hypothetical protein ACFC18_21930 [Streptomyces sp. NPDC056121]|uniref:hypothetical protein n=1 Tax=unclassified Streptomyces TaxID=2593676 RepID=UPI0035D982F8
MEFDSGRATGENRPGRSGRGCAGTEDVTGAQNALFLPLGPALEVGSDGRPTGIELELAELPLQEAELVAEGQDFGVLLAVGHRQQPECCDGLGHGEVGRRTSMSSDHAGCQTATSWLR